MKIKSRPGTVEKYLYIMQNLSQESGMYSNVNDISLKYQVGRQYVQVLKNRNMLIVDNNGYYRWNKAVTPSVDVVNSILKEISITNRRYMALRKANNKQQQLNLDLKPKVSRPRKPKVQEPKVGIIRRIFKFIW